MTMKKIVMLWGRKSDKKGTSVRRWEASLPNGDWIACVSWVMYVMFLKRSASSEVLTPSRQSSVTPASSPCQWTNRPVGRSAHTIQFCGMLENLNLFSISRV